MDEIFIEEKRVLEYLKDVLNELIVGSLVVENARYHHNASYKNSISRCLNGILTIADLKNIMNLNEGTVVKFGDIESHINGNDSVSLAVVGLDDLYKDEDEYNPFHPDRVDFLISSDIRAYRSTLHYGNEYLHYGSIGVDKLKAVDIRLLKLIQLFERNNSYTSIENVIEKYNYLREISKVIKQLDLPLREMSEEKNLLLDNDKLSKLPKLVLKPM